MKQKTHAAEHTEEHAQSRSMMQEVWRRFKKNKGAVVGLCIFLVICVLAISAGFVYDYDTQVVGGDVTQRLQSPSWEHPFGTDEMGRDILIRVIYGARYSLSVGVVAVAIALVIGVSLGALAGYVGGITENIIMRITDIFIAVPNILLAIAIVALLGPGIINVFIAVMVFTVPSFARIMRSATLAVKGSLYVEVAQSLGCKDSRLLFVHIFPGTIQSLIVNFTMRIGSAIMAASSLSFLGFGANVTDPEWGAMLSQSRSYLNVAPHMVYFPGLVIFVTVLAFNLFGDGLRDTLDPKIK